MALNLGKQFHAFFSLPDEILAQVLSYLPLVDLVNVRSVCSRLQALVDDSDYSQSLWSKASLHNLWPSPDTLAVFERSAKHKNVEALIKLAVAYLYSEGVQDGPGKGTVFAHNGIKAAHYLIQAESLLVKHKQPFSWVLIRPPFASTCVCSKSCICHHMKEYCVTSVRDCTHELVPSLYYVVGKVMTYFENDIERMKSHEWFQQGVENGCNYSIFESWKLEYQQCQDEVQSIRTLRSIVGLPNTNIDAQFELCKLYSIGKFGGISRSLAYQYIRQVMNDSPLILSNWIYDKNITQDMMFILLDWVVEVAEMKEFSTKTLHLAINLIQRYVTTRTLSRSHLQLLGVTALLIAARWTDIKIITIREAAWLTDNTYKYEEVVRMIGELIATLSGEIQKPLISDYLEIFFALVEADQQTRFLATYLSEAAVVFFDFGKFKSSLLAGSCLLLSKIVLGQEFPWSSMLVEASGLALHDLYECTLLVYNKCLTDETTIVDHRGIKLCSIKAKYASERFMSVSEMEFIMLDQVKERLGLIPSVSNTNVEDSIVTQSFMDTFDCQTISDFSSLLPDGHYYNYQQDSPQASIGSLLPVSPIVFDASTSCSSDRSSTSQPSLSSLSPSLSPVSDTCSPLRVTPSSLSVSLPLLSGIEPLNSEETVNLNSLHITSSKCPTFSNQENKSLHAKLRKNISLPESPIIFKPLSSLTNILHHNNRRIQTEKRLSLEHNVSDNKRHRSGSNSNFS